MLSVRKASLAVVGVLAASAALVGLSPAAPATATGKCTTVTHLTLDGVTTSDEATAVLTANGLRIRTPKQESRVSWSKTVNVKLSNVTELGYTTFKHAGTNAAALPAYVLGIDADGDPATANATLVYEPYFQPGADTSTGKLRTWDVDDGKFWASKPGIPGLANPTPDGSTAGSYTYNRTLAQIAAENPKAVITSFGIRMGTWNHDTDATANKVRFGQKGECNEHVWAAPETRPTVKFVDACDGSTKVTVYTPEQGTKSWTFAIDRKGDDVPPKLIPVAAGQTGVWTMGPGNGAIEVYAYKHGQIRTLTGFSVLGGGKGKWDHGKEWVKVGDHTWKLPKRCKPTSGAGSTCTRFNISVSNPDEAAKAVEAVLTPGPAAETATVELKPGETKIVEYDAGKVQKVTVTFDGGKPTTHQWKAPENCEDEVPPPAPGGGGGEQPALPVTGVQTGAIAGAAAALLAIGAALFVVSRRRRTRFTA